MRLGHLDNQSSQEAGDILQAFQWLTDARHEHHFVVYNVVLNDPGTPPSFWCTIARRTSGFHVEATLRSPSLDSIRVPERSNWEFQSRRLSDTARGKNAEAR